MPYMFGDITYTDAALAKLACQRVGNESLGCQTCADYAESCGTEGT
jgi:hypothetical protein